MRTKWIKALFATSIAAIVLIGGCGQNEPVQPDKPAAAPQEQPREHVDNPPERQEPANEETGETSTSDTEGPQNESPANEQPAQDAPVEKTYHMNKAFFIKPNDESMNKKVVLLTFDDGPKEEVMLTSILDTLDKHQAKAIFFVNGFRVKAHPELLKLIDERGQIIGNHSWDHIILKNESEQKIDQQLEDVQTIVQETTGQSPLFFRPPNGAGNDYIRAKAKELGMLYMTWSNGSLDWADNRNNPDGVIDSVMEQLAPGSNILMHELPWTAEALDGLLAKITEEGYSFVDPRAIELEAR